MNPVAPVARRAQQAERRLNPFVFPSETNGRFGMLVIAAVLVGITLGIVAVAGFFRVSYRKEMENFTDRTFEVVGRRDPRDLKPEEILKVSRELPSLNMGMFIRLTPRLIAPILCASFILGFAAVLYFRHPRRLRRRYKSHALIAEHAPSVATFLQKVTTSLALAPPRLEVTEEENNFAEAQTFGLPGKEVLLLHGSPGFLERTWGDTARTVLLHEVGHIVNGDAQDREKSRALWIAFAAFIALMLLLVGVAILTAIYFAKGAEATRASLGVVGLMLLRAAGLLVPMMLLIWSIWFGLIRIREYYADYRVMQWGFGKALKNLLRMKERKGRWWERSKLWSAAWERWGQENWWKRLAGASEWILERIEPLWKSHPSYRQRQRALEESTQLFRISSDLALITGLLLSLLVTNLVMPTFELAAFLSLITDAVFWWLLGPLFAVLSHPWNEYFLILGRLIVVVLPLVIFCSLAMVIPTYLVARVLGVQVQREAMADLAKGDRWGYLRSLRPAILLSLGLEGGFLLTPIGLPLRSHVDTSLRLFWLGSMSVFVWLWLLYTRALTRFTLGVHVGATFPRGLSRRVNISAVVLLLVLFWPIGFARLAFLIHHEEFPSWGFRDVSSAQNFGGFIYATSIMLAFFALVFYVVWAGIVAVAVAMRLWARRAKYCPSCGEPVVLGFAVGRPCASCGEPLAAWAYDRPGLGLGG